ncbi:MAG: hypothetical protein HQL23_02560 [Candidatus Omnitrophica bacterium]|nr:hypothetical protein [Candidatus Omnitrophota bacterium]
MAHIIGGAIAAVLGICGIIGWWDNFGDFLRGGVPLFLLIGGLIALNTGLKLTRGKQ